MKIIYNKLIPFKGFTAINIFGIVFAQKEYRPLSERTITHEAIHTAQLKEMLYIFFYLWYGVEWLLRWVCCGFKGKQAYKNILFEREAYLNDTNPNYLKDRKPFSWLK